MLQIGYIVFFTLNIIRYDDVNHRTFDSTAGHYARLSFRLFHEEGHVAEAAEVAARLCIGCDGGSINLVAVDSFDGDGGRQRQVVGFACCRRIPVGYGIPIDD